MTDEDYLKILKHGTFDQLGPATVEMLVARGVRRAGLAKLVSALQHKMFDEGFADGTTHAPQAKIVEEYCIIKH